MYVNLFDPSEFGFPEGSAIFNYPPDAKKAINEARMRIRGGQAYSKFWNRVLDAHERNQLGNDLEACWQQNHCSINLLCRLREWTAERAIVEIAHKIGFMDPAEYQWLLEVAGDPLTDESSTTVEPTPSWNRETGLLEFAGQLCREIRVARATTITPVLDEFQAAGWPPSIVYVNNTVDDQRIHQVRRNLNSDLHGIYFTVQGQNICWHPSSPTTAS